MEQIHRQTKDYFFCIKIRINICLLNTNKKQFKLDVSFYFLIFKFNFATKKIINILVAKNTTLAGILNEFIYRINHYKEKSNQHLLMILYFFNIQILPLESSIFTSLKVFYKIKCNKIFFYFYKFNMNTEVVNALFEHSRTYAKYKITSNLLNIDDSTSG